jgi:hypothetical protein
MKSVGEIVKKKWEELFENPRQVLIEAAQKTRVEGSR